ncbi:MAG: radical SAM protein [Candidatus Methanoperedens sp.]|nr:radical SAM protein [Candidatus Methanoperedens sp.]
MLTDFKGLIEYLRDNGVTSHFTMGGHFPTIEFQKVLDMIPGLDTVVRHEGEETLLELYRNLHSPDLWGQIRGIAYRIGSNVEVTPPRPLIKDLDSLPFPTRNSEPRTNMGLGMASVLASRGCYYNCTFCSIKEFYKDAPGLRRRSRSPPNVAKEINQLFEKGTRIFNFRDDDFSLKGSQKKWNDEFALELNKKGLADQILWRISCRCDEVDAEMINMLKEVGLAFIYLGIESGSNQGLITFNKHYEVDEVYRTLEILEMTKMNFEYGFMLLNPDTDFNSIKENIYFLNELGKDGRAVVHFTKMLPYAGTPIARRLKKEDRLKGTLVSPDYNYTDSRIDLFEVFLTQSFHHMLFASQGLVNKLQFAQFNSVVLDKFYFYLFDTQAYSESIKNITKKCNDCTIETITRAEKFMENKSYEDILQNWHVLKDMTEQTLNAQSRIEAELDSMLNSEILPYL